MVLDSSVPSDSPRWAKAHELPPKPPIPGKAAVSVREAAWMLDCSQKFVRFLIYSKQVRAWHVQGGKWRIEVGEIEAYKDQKTPAPLPRPDKPKRAI